MDRLFIDEEHITLIRELGEGSYGKVYAGECLKKPVAVKVIGRTKLSKLTKEEFEELEREMLIMTYVYLSARLHAFIHLLRFRLAKASTVTSLWPWALAHMKRDWLS